MQLKQFTEDFKNKIEKFIALFQNEYNLNEYELGEIFYSLNDERKDEVAHIDINHIYKTFNITLYVDEIDEDNPKMSLLATLLHELSHLLTYEVDYYQEILKKSDKATWDKVAVPLFDNVMEIVTEKIVKVITPYWQPKYDKIFKGGKSAKN